MRRLAVEEASALKNGLPRLLQDHGDSEDESDTIKLLQGDSSVAEGTGLQQIMHEIVQNASATNSNYNLNKYKAMTDSLKQMSERNQTGLGKRTAL